MIANLACFFLLVPLGPGHPKCSHQSWCNHQLGLALPQMLSSSLLLDFAYPVALTSSIILYSKMLGPIPQGVAMGVLTSVGSAARMIGPVSIMYLYESLGPEVAFPIVCGLIGASILMLLLVYRRLLPHVAFRTPPASNTLLYSGKDSAKTPAVREPQS